MANSSFKQFLARVPTDLAIALALAVVVVIAGASSQVFAVYKSLNRQATVDAVGVLDVESHMASVYPMFGMYALALVLAGLAGYATLRGARRLADRAPTEDAEARPDPWPNRWFWLGLAIPAVSLAGLVQLGGHWDDTPGNLWLAAWQGWGGLSLLAALVWAAGARVVLPRGRVPGRNWIKWLILFVVWVAWLVGGWHFTSATAGAALLLPPLLLWLLWPTAYRAFGLGLGAALLGMFLTRLWWLMPHCAVVRIWHTFNNSDPLGVNFQYVQASRSLAHGGGWGADSADFIRLHFLPRAHDQYLLTSFAEHYGQIPAGLLAASVLALLLWALWRILRPTGPAGLLKPLGIALALLLLSQAGLAISTGFAWLKVPAGMGLPILTAHTGLALWVGVLGGLVAWALNSTIHTANKEEAR